MRSLAAVFLALAACEPAPPLELGGEGLTWADEGLELAPADPRYDHDQAPPPGLLFDQDALIPGTDVTLRVEGAAPGDVVYFGRSSTGTGAGPCIPFFGVCLSLLPQVDLIGVTVADNAGNADYTIRLPNNTPPMWVYTQAVITGPAGSVATNTITAQVLRGHLDGDGDGYCGGRRCHDPFTAPNDCHDGNTEVFPGQPVFFEIPYETDSGGLSYDYDCDGRERKFTTQEFQCTPATLGGLPLGFCRDVVHGWDLGVPDCGETGDWGTGCIAFDFGGFAICSPGNYQTALQTCH